MGVHKSSIPRLKLKVDVVGLDDGVKDKKGGGKKRKSTDEQEALLVELVQRHPFKITPSIRELRDEELGNLSIRLVQKILKRKG